jgi:hypothetical protein
MKNEQQDKHGRLFGRWLGYLLVQVVGLLAIVAILALLKFIGQVTFGLGDQQALTFAGIATLLVVLGSILLATMKGGRS